MTEIAYPQTLSPLSRAEILEKMHHRLDDERFNHCVRVETTARVLAGRFGVDIDRAGLAGLLHDYAKQISVKDYQNLIQTQGLDPELLNYGRGIWHGLVGVWFIQRELGVSDPEVLQAIVRHTTGDPAMTALDQIIFVADFIEPARDLPGEIAAREAAEHDLLEATLIELTNTLTYLIDNRKVVYPKTLATYNALIKR
ncbi:bis(5'-nucleosyl)-tetraphosphatase (symmetrical) YqeK [Lacticaseibacillus brantae]|uniref:bis(5'-nucleosyl)-tetraphosphatase (symmetrical) YqeK n=1 Tax=Lacticaseibacillus brantae TaxID=943673 RepID=UPI000709460B|nr:bis(5'-nucleosyl)-tetraphosphatase (symmetrical) YqeK [Lacticaseibacillus brantae]